MRPSGPSRDHGPQDTSALAKQSRRLRENIRTHLVDSKLRRNIQQIWRWQGVVNPRSTIWPIGPAGTKEIPTWAGTSECAQHSPPRAVVSPPGLPLEQRLEKLKVEGHIVDTLRRKFKRNAVLLANQWAFAPKPANEDKRTQFCCMPPMT